MDNKFYKNDISKFDPSNAPAEEVRKWLFAVIDAELEKDDEKVDYDLIEECIKLEAELPDMDFEISESEYAAGLERIKASAPATEHKALKILSPKKKPQKSVRVIAILAATLAVIMLSLTVTASIQGVSALNFLFDNKDCIIDMDNGDNVEKDSIKLIKNGETNIYSSIEDVIYNIDYDILYPYYLPEGVVIERIVVTDIGDGKVQIIFITNQQNLWIDIINPPVTNEEKLEKLDKCNYGEIDFYILQKAFSCQAYTFCDNMEYNIKCNNYDELINILKGLRKVE